MSTFKCKENYTKCEQISRLTTEGPAHKNLRRHIRKSAFEARFLKTTPIRALNFVRQTKVSQLQIEVLVEKDVLKFDVFVDVAELVNTANCFQELN